MNLNGWNCVINDLPENGTKCMCILNMSSIAEICTFENNCFNRSGVMFWIKLDDLLKDLKDVLILPNVNAGYFLTKDKEDIRVRYYKGKWILCHGLQASEWIGGIRYGKEKYIFRR